MLLTKLHAHKPNTLIEIEILKTSLFFGHPIYPEVIITSNNSATLRNTWHCMQLRRLTAPLIIRNRLSHGCASRCHLVFLNSPNFNGNRLSVSLNFKCKFKQWDLIAFLISLFFKFYRIFVGSFSRDILSVDRHRI